MSMTELVPTLPAHWYHDPKIFEKERESIFGKEWLYAAESADLKEPGHYVSFRLAGYPLLMIRGEDQKVRAFHNYCRHRAAPLLPEGKGHLKSPTMTCKYHGWTYGTDGQLLSAPFCSSDICQKKELSLNQIQVGQFHEMFFVNLDPHAAPFEKSWAGVLQEFKDSAYPIQDYHWSEQMMKVGNFNWKVWMEGYQECYHCPTIHPVLNKDFNLKKYKIENKEKYSLHSCERKSESALGTFQGLWLWIYPNHGLPCYEPCTYVLQVNPLDATHTELNYRFRFRSDTNEQERAEFVDLVKKITHEDLDVCEQVQKTLTAGVYKNGYLNLERENGVKYFHDLIRAGLS